MVFEIQKEIMTVKWFLNILESWPIGQRLNCQPTVLSCYAGLNLVFFCDMGILMDQIMPRFWEKNENRSPV